MAIFTNQFNLSAGCKNYTFDAIRGLAVLLVLFSHLDNYALLYIWPISAKAIQAFMGKCGVYLFFLLSGYLIWASASNQLSKVNGLKKYFIHRITRIYPLYITCIIALVALAPYFIGYKKPEFDISIILRHLLFLQSFTPDVSGAINSPFWTLTHEAMFYLIVPIIFLFAHKNKILFFTIIVSQIAWLLYGPHLHQFINYWCLFALGIITYHNQCVLNKLSSLTLMFCGLVLCVLYPKILLFQMLVAVGLFHYLIHFNFQSLIAKPMVGLGVISYSVYVWHYPIIHFVTPYIIKYTSPPTELISIINPWLPYGLYLESLLVILVIILFSTASYYLIEKPSMTTLRNKITQTF